MLETFFNLLMFVWFVLPLMMWLSRFAASRRIHGVILYVVALAIGYLVYVGAAWAADVILEQRMNSFDLDGDGGIGGEELTPEAQEAMDAWASDTGRTFAFIFGLPVTAIWAGICLTPLCIGEWIVRRLIGQRNPAATRSDVVHLPSDDPNPYRAPGGD